MERDTLTKTELRIVTVWRATGLNPKAKPAILRRIIRRTAYHEAAHVAARMFTGLESGHIIHVSIIPDANNNGHVRSERNFAESCLASYPPPRKRSAGRCLLLDMLAGRGAEARIAAPDDREDILDEDALWMEGEHEGTDLYRAQRVAKIIAWPHMPAYRVLTLAAKWTEEMLTSPSVWATVERLAAMLLERGIIEDRDEIMAACNGIICAAWKLPKWRRRLHD